MHSENHVVKLRAARAAALAGGKSPRQRGREKALQALQWVYRWGWSSPTILDKLVGDKGNGLTARLVKAGLLTRTRTESGGGHKDIPAYIATLTEAGIHEVERTLEDPNDLLPYDTDPYRVDQRVLRHDSMIQRATVASLATGTISDYQSERMLTTKSAAGVKEPDALWILPGGYRCAIELELSAKWSRDLDQFVNACLAALAGPPPRFDRILIVSDSRAILTRYRAALKPGARYSIWSRDKSRHWQQTDTALVPDWIEGKIICSLLKQD